MVLDTGRVVLSQWLAEELFIGEEEDAQDVAITLLRWAEVENINFVPVPKSFAGAQAMAVLPAASFAADSTATGPMVTVVDSGNPVLPPKTGDSIIV